MRPISMFVFAAGLALASCGEKAVETKPSEAPATPAATPPVPSAPAIDTEALKAKLPPDGTLEVLSFDAAGSARASGEVKGYAAPVYAVAVAAGQTLNVVFETTSTNLYMNVVDSADSSGAAVHRGEADGANATLTAAKPTIYLIQPFQPRATARRGEAGAFTLTVTRK